ncbi:hypothetical protein GCM10009125_20130 [Castellaniella daejeonensis]|uniref:Uncharacterized protein n=1 Tax=Castellaniella daejeonensis TaxID=659013 RepID=A0ABP3DI21_9BURK
MKSWRNARSGFPDTDPVDRGRIAQAGPPCAGPPRRRKGSSRPGAGPCRRIGYFCGPGMAGVPGGRSAGLSGTGCVARRMDARVLMVFPLWNGYIHNENMDIVFPY